MVDQKEGEDSEEMLQQQQQHFHVLAVDDSVLDRKLLEKLLTVSSYHVTCVESGNKALEYLGLLDNIDNSNNTTVLPSPSSSSSSSAFSSSSSSSASQKQMQDLKVHLIMTDYCMPGMSGYDLLQRVKQSSWKDVPVIVMSSENEPSTINMCLEGGADEFLLKPVQLADVKKLHCHLLKPFGDNIEDTNNNAYKRKALSQELSERRSKWKAQPMV